MTTDWDRLDMERRIEKATDDAYYAEKRLKEGTVAKLEASIIELTAAISKATGAGWVVTLAGAEGKALESRFGTLLAAMKIYDASDPSYRINPCRFFDSNEDALADMKRLAEKSA